MSNKTGFFSKLFGREEDEMGTTELNEDQNVTGIVIRSPLKGTITPLSEINDEVFSRGIMGKGTAIIPCEGKLYSPVNGRITAVFPTKHAIGIVDNNNVEILIHLGMDTVELKGKYFKQHIKKDSTVRVGDLIMEFDIEKIKEAGYEVVTPIVITNTSSFRDIIITDAENADVKDLLMNIIK